jgi:hypothetical protein
MPKFQLGVIVTTPGVADIVSPDRMRACLSRHADGDWGVLEEDDRKANDAALASGDRLLSVYEIDPTRPPEHNTFWIITESDRSVTTFLLPDEY